MTRRITTVICAGSAALLFLALTSTTANAQAQLQVYGAWHCYTDGCSWASVPNMTTFDTDNRWMIDRDLNSTYLPSVNLVILSFVDPVKLMNLTTDSGDTNGIPVGMNTAVISYFQSRGVRVMMSIGGASYRKNWDKALSTNPTALGINAANAAKQFNVGMEIDYENSSSPNLSGLQSFVTAYRSVVPYDATGANYAARLTIDLGDGDTYLTKLAGYAVTNWLQTNAPVLDYANAMVASQKTGVATLESGWQQHVDGLSGSVSPMAPAKLTGSLWLIGGKANCDNFSNSDQNTAASFVENLAPAGAGTTTGMLGYMFWAAGCQGNGTGCTFPPNTCENGMGGAMTAFGIPVPMPALRQN
ncbi:MAG TPA: hypothetical protein VE377_21950 [Candidatus Dormibacteraeota bacterium]|nr:hypothetical protein [Candidatus Dormibacteraeota bacterium]